MANMKRTHQEITKRLRTRAEKLLAKIPRDLAARPAADVQKLLHELQIHQIELEMQNDQLRRTELELEEALDRYAGLYHFAPVAYLSLSPQGKILEANLRAAELLGLQRGLLMHQKFTQFVRAEAQGAFYLFCRQVFSTETRQSAELELVTAQAKRLVAQVEAVCDPASPLEQARFSLTDITGRKQAEQDLQARDAQLYSFVQQAPAAIAMFDRHMICLAASQRWTTDFGHEHRDVIGLNHYAAHPDMPERWKEIHQKALAGESLSCDEDGRLQADGSKVWLRWSVSPWRDVRGDIRGLMILRENITEWRQAEAALRESEEKYRNLFANMAEEVHFWKLVRDAQGRIKTWRLVDANPPTLKTWGKALDEIKGRTTDEIFGASSAAHYLAVVQKIMTGGVPHFYEDYFPNLDKHFRFTSVPLGEYFITTGADITTIKKAHENLRVSEERYRSQHALLRTLIDLAPDFIFVKDTEGRFLVVNEALAKCYGRQPAEMLNRTDADFLPSELAARFRAGEAQALAADSFRSFEDSFTLPDGQPRAVVTNMVAFRDPQGTVKGLVGIGHDITGLKQAEKNLRILTRALEQSPTSVVITNTSGAIEYVNPKFTEITGYSLAEVLGQNPRLLNSGRHAPEFYQELWTTILSGCDWRGEFCNKKKDGSLFWESAVIAPIHDEHGTVTHFVALKEDITDRRRLEAELIEVADREQQRIGHDLHDGLGQRLTALEMQCFLLQEDLATADRPASRRKLQQQVRQLSGALRECITVTRSIARDLAPAVLQREGLMGALEQLAHRTHLPGKLECRFVCLNPVVVEDFQSAKQLYRIAQEAVNNALKHARTRRLRLRLTHTNGLLCLQIKDEGRGLPQRRSKSGIGLEVMRHRAHAIGATLEIDSQPGQGVSVTCTLPIRNHENQKMPTGPD